MKPLVRWIVGNCHNAGIISLIQSIKNFKKLYKNKFRYCICYNNLSDKQLKKIKILTSSNIKLINQENYISEFDINPCGPAWKLYPARLSLETHEIIIDNDLILFKKLTEIEDLIENDKPFITEALKNCYGNFDNLISKNTTLNTGFIGYPPNFDIKKMILETIHKSKINCWSDHFDEQGCIASIFEKIDYNLITLNKINVCDHKLKMGSHGIHLIGLNGGWTHLFQSMLKLL